MRFQFARSSGPGGQNVNKVNTKAELWVPVNAIVGMNIAAIERLQGAAGHRLTAAGEIHIVCDVERSQSANREAILTRLREMIVEAQRVPKVRRKTKPSRRAKQRRLESKRRRGEVKALRRGGGRD